MQHLYTFYLSLGSNLGEREETLRSALQLIGQQIGKVTRCSSFFYSEPWGFQSDHAFCNLCCAVETPLEPLEMLSATQSIERTLGRTTKSVNGIYHDRPIDIDLIRAFDPAGKEITMKNDQMVNDQLVNVLTLPHPLYRQRDFVTIPLREIYPNFEN